MNSSDTEEKDQYNNSDSEGSLISNQSNNTSTNTSSIIDIEKASTIQSTQNSLDEDFYLFEHGATDANRIRFRGQVFGIDFHPSEPLMACSLLSGELACYALTYDKSLDVLPSLAFKDTSTFKESCREVCFSSDGNTLISIASDRSYAIHNTSTGQLIHKQEEACEASIYSLLCIDENLIACGDDSGIVKLFDLRSHKSVVQYHEHEDYITKFSLGKHPKHLISIGGDGYLSVVDVRKPKLYARSDQMDDELLSMGLIKNGNKLVVGTSSGVLDIFDYGDWGDFKDRFVGHPESVDGMVVLDEDTIITGSSDGLLRVVSILPNSLLGVVGAHDFPVERLAITKDKGLLASCSHDHSVRFWNLKKLIGIGEDDEEDDEEEEEEDNEEDSSDNQSEKSKLKAEDDEYEEEQINNKNTSYQSNKSSIQRISKKITNQDIIQHEDPEESPIEDKTEHHFHPRSKKAKHQLKELEKKNDFFGDLD